MKKPEILAPTGTLSSVIAALNGGCDAIYIGGQSFNARAYADNPSDDTLKDIIFMCHLRGVKVFITLNILYKENEINDVLKFVSKIYSYGAYGIIVQDIGIANIIKQNFPDICLSASTQMTVHNKDGVKLAKELGFSRVVLARELSKNEISDIVSADYGIEIEGFIHGALCVCYSGRCLMSSFIGGRSGNRGRCAQPCRMEYTLFKNDNSIKKGYLLSPKDISTINIIDDVVNTGIDSLKIEGRMKSPEYVYQVVSTYRKYIDNKFDNVDKTDLKNLTQIFNRGGSSSHGYWDTYSGNLMMSTQTPKSSGVEIGIVQSYNPKTKKCTIKLYDDIIAGDGIEIWSNPHIGTGINKPAQKGDVITVNVSGRVQKGCKVFKSYDKALNDKLKKTYTNITRKLKINIDLRVIEDENMLISFPDYGISISGDMVQTAQNKPMSADDIIKRFKKTGDTAFEFEVVNYEIGDNVYVPVSAINELRRTACTKLEKLLHNNLIRDNINAVYKPSSVQKAENPNITVLVRTMEQFKAAIDSDAEIIYCNILDENLAETAIQHNKKLYYALPNISRDGYAKYINKLDNTPCEGYIVRSYGKLNTQKEVVTDYTLNVTNSLTINKLRDIYKCNRISLSPELNIRELTDIADENCEIVVYGRLPLMTTHQCPVGLYDAGKKGSRYCKCKNSNDTYYLKDRMGVNFPILRDCQNCIAYILNSAPINTIDKYDNILSIGAGYHRIELTTEDYNTSYDIIQAYTSRGTLNIKNSTAGHYYRGVK